MALQNDPALSWRQEVSKRTRQKNQRVASNYSVKLIYCGGGVSPLCLRL